MLLAGVLILTVGMIFVAGGSDDIRDVVFRECNLKPSSTAPNEFDTPRIPSQLQVSAFLDRLVDINGLDETFTVTGGLGLTFYLPCVQKSAAKYNLSRTVSNFWAITNTDDYWRPGVIQPNSRSDYGLSKNVLPLIVVFPFQGIIQYAYTGSLTTVCTLEFRNFPFDQQRCTINFILWLTKEMVNVTKFDIAFMKSKEKLISSNLGWDLLGISTDFEIVSDSRDEFPENYYNLEVTLRLKRRPDYYVFNIITPCFVLTIAQLATFLMPPGFGDRPTFAITVLLSFTVIQGNVLANVPKTPQDILLDNVILGEMACGMVVTFYAAILCGFVDSFEKRAEHAVKIFDRFYTRFCRLMDSAAFLVSMLTIVLLNVIVLPLIIGG